MDLTKKELEELIRQEKTIGKYIFDENKKCFFGSAEVVLYITEIEENKFQSQMYYFDGYEIWLDDNEKEFYNGNLGQAEKMVIDSFNSQPELFMGFPILYTNMSCELVENDEE